MLKARYSSASENSGKNRMLITSSIVWSHMAIKSPQSLKFASFEHIKNSHINKNIQVTSTNSKLGYVRSECLKTNLLQRREERV